MTRRLHTLAATLLLTLTLGTTAPHHALAHSHHEDADATTTTAAASPWESSAIYELAAGNYSLKLCTASDDVVQHDNDDGMIFELLALASSSDSDVHAATTRADEIVRAFATDEVVHERVRSDSTTPTMLQIKTNTSSAAPDVLYRAEFASASACIDAALPVAHTGVFMLFTQHGADEVRVEVVDTQTQQRVVASQCVTGCDDDAIDDDEHTPSTSWLGPVAASLVISLTSFVGVFVLGLSQRRAASAVEYMTSFAAGCLLGVVVFHLYPEGTEYLADLGEWVMGVWVLTGIAFSMSIESGVHMVLAAFGHDHSHSHGGHNHSHGEGDVDAEKGHSLHATLSTEYVAHPTTPDAVASASTPTDAHDDHTDAHDDHTDADDTPQSFSAKYIRSLRFVEPVAWITAVGDFFHAFTDGVVLAVAFKSCSASLGWAVALGVVLHEVPHRVGDFFIYLKAGMGVAQALAVNFVASLASLLGAVILLAAGTVSDHALGFLMGFGCGALLFIGLSVLLPPMLAVRDRRGAALHFFWFALGCVLIGLSVLQHTHCDAAENSSSGAHSH